jgi:class 3 adenylate cyclase
MYLNAREVEDLVKTHLDEAGGGVIDCQVSELARGESTTRDYFILKIDIVGSTRFLYRARGAPYVRLAHAYLSSVDKITQSYGADPEQTEYHGDSVLAFFPLRGNAAEDVLTASAWSHFAVKRLRELDEDFRALALSARTVLHYGPLNVANIGPYGESHRVAIGIPIHQAASREKSVDGGKIWVSEAFAKELRRDIRAQLLERNYKVEMRQEQILVHPPSSEDTSRNNLLAALLRRQTSPLGNAFNPVGLGSALAPPAIPLPPRYETRSVEHKVEDGYVVKIVEAYRQLRIPLFGSAIK